MVLLKELFKNWILKKKTSRKKKAWKITQYAEHYTCMRSYLVGLKDWILVWAFSRVPSLCVRAAKALAIPKDCVPEILIGTNRYTHALSMRAVKALVRLRVCAGSSEHSPLVFAISTPLSQTGSTLARTNLDEVSSGLARMISTQVARTCSYGCYERWVNVKVICSLGAFQPPDAYLNRWRSGRMHFCFCWCNLCFIERSG